MIVNQLVDDQKHQREQLLQLLRTEYKKPFAGWDSHLLKGVMVEQTNALPWNYETTVRDLLPHAKGLLDMGTGNGEFLASLAPLPRETCATEGWPPNIAIARQRLTPLGVTVTAITDIDVRLPLNDARFDLVINRHGTYSPFEVHRLLKPEGLFITQQVGDRDSIELKNLLGTPEMFTSNPQWNLKAAAEQLVTNGFKILEEHEAFPEMRFYDVRAVICYFKAIIQDFTMDKYSEQFTALDRRIRDNGSVSFNSHRFFVKAQKQ